MHKAARQRCLLDLLSESGQLTIASLASSLQVSFDTVRRDLRELEQQGLLQKNHGGAIALDVPAMGRTARSKLLPQVKQRLGKLVADRIPPGVTLLLDAGSTLLAVAVALKGPARVITTSLDIALCLCDRPDIELILPGGLWDRRQRLLAGAATLSTLRGYRADIAILGACAVHAQLGLSASDEADAEVKRAMLEISLQHWLVTDHLKFDRCEPHLIASLAQIDCLFTDRPWPALGDRHSVDVTIITDDSQGVNYE